MPSFIYVSIFIFFIIQLYLLRKFPAKYSHTVLCSLLALGLAFLITAVALQFPLLQRYITPAINWIVLVYFGFSLIAFASFLVCDIIYLLLYLVKDNQGICIALKINRTATKGIALLIAVLITVYSIYAAQNVQVKHIVIATDKLPLGVERLRIVGVSDIHLGMLINGKMLSYVAGLIQNEKPDIIVIAGDLVDAKDMSGRDQEAEILRNLQSTYGKFVIHGNHEAYNGLQNSRAFMKKSGLTILESQMVQVGGIIIVGHIDKAFGDFNLGPKELSFTQITANQPLNDKFVLYLKHRPDPEPDAAGLFDLQFSGHTHGGQIWPGIFLSYLKNSVWQGFTELTGEKGTSLIFTTNGVGFWGPPLRFLADPEIIVFDLVSKSTAIPSQ